MVVHTLLMSNAHRARILREQGFDRIVKYGAYTVKQRAAIKRFILARAAGSNVKFPRF